MTIDLFPTLHCLARPDLTPALLTVSRSGATATRVDARGRVETVAANSLRHDYDSANGAYLGWLVEEGRTNLLLHSRDASQAAWNKTGCTAALTARGLDGQAGSATTLTATAANATLLQAVTAGNAAYTLSVDLRRVSGSGSVALTLDGGATWTEVSGGLASQRFVRISQTQTLTNPAIGLKLAVSGDAVALDHAQLEAGAFATSRISTTTAPVSRSADVLTLNPSQNWFNPEEGAIYAEAMIGTSDINPKTLFSSAATPDTVEMSVGDPNSGLANNIGAIASGFSGVSPSARAIALRQPFRAALAWSPTGGGTAQDGSAYQQFSTGTGWECGQIALGCQLRDGPKRFLNGWLRHVAVFPRRLGTAQLIELTS